MYRHASAGGNREGEPSGPAEQSMKALAHMVAALQILDDSGLSPLAGARLDHAIEILREEMDRAG